MFDEIGSDRHERIDADTLSQEMFARFRPRLTKHGCHRTPEGAYNAGSLLGGQRAEDATLREEALDRLLHRSEGGPPVETRGGLATEVQLTVPRRFGIVRQVQRDEQFWPFCG